MSAKRPVKGSGFSGTMGPMTGNGTLDLERCRAYLRSLALILMAPKLRSKMDASDLVQKTLLDAHRDRDQFAGKTEAELRAWLRKMLLHDLADELDRWGRGKRDVDVEVSIDRTKRLADALRNPAQGTPSADAMKNEQALRLTDAISRLGDDQRRAVELHHLQEYSLEETAETMGRSFGSVASLIHRALAELRSLMHEGTRHV